MSPKVVLSVLFLVTLAGCASYKQNIMFKPGENFKADPIQDNVLKAERNYIIQKNDFLVLEVYSNSGEKLIDPNPELSHSQPAGETTTEEKKYLVDLNGVVKFPMVGELKVEGLTLRQTELMLQKAYEQFFKTPFVTLKFNNKRVIVLGAPGGQVIPLTNENMTLAEVLALAKGINFDGKAKNIRVLRNEKVYLADFSTIDGFHKANMIIEHGDIVYVEPVRRPIAEGIQDYRLLITMLVSVTTFIALLTR